MVFKGVLGCDSPCPDPHPHSDPLPRPQGDRPFDPPITALGWDKSKQLGPGLQVPRPTRMHRVLGVVSRY